MKLLKFSTYEQYVEAQRRSDKRKSPRPGLKRVEVSDVASWLRHCGAAVRAGLCHGARAGQEVDWYQQEFPKSRVWGTDLFLKGHRRILEWDFSRPRAEWVGVFDFVYSNALDHARDPVETLKVWADQLKPTGHLLIQWNAWQTKTKGGDCFGAEFHEYLSMLESVARVVNVIWHYGSVVTICCEKRV
jgi:SAM-dependent methyltransferase